ncbi:hypothetical protein FYJ91_08735 [Sphingomonas montanisoli]|uniref:Glycosyltransferase RgtA/B/C/D-like domain-containing protein n=1 Tax=Sphingomonas montanisoli TaxID=2606412 RepID=A0A5D9C929_9SPHN|nr:hypothetical protein FYJ91_08735 [Sphingomonas montanisoli]
MARLHPIAARLTLALIVIAGLTIAVARIVGFRIALAVVALYAALVPSLAIYATELKYYGVEIAGTATIVAWFVSKSRRAPFALPDLAILVAGIACGISTILSAGIATGCWAVLAFIRRRRFSASELGFAAILAVIAVGYYALIRHGSAVQIHNFPNAYGQSGQHAALAVPSAILGLFGNRAPVLALIVLINLTGWRAAATQRLLLILAVIVLSCTALAAFGVYPATAPRHVAWFHGFALLLLANALQILIAGQQRRTHTARTALVLFLGAIAAAATGMTIAKAFTTHFAHEENDPIVAWLAQPRDVPIGLWGGTQPLIQYYRTQDPAVGRHRIFGLADPRSAPVPPRLFSPTFLQQPYDRIAAAVEAGRMLPGGFDLRILYQLRHDYHGAAEALLAEAPRGLPFYIVASHVDWDAPVPLSAEPRSALLDALEAQKCRYLLELKAKEVFILRAICPER